MLFVIMMERTSFSAQYQAAWEHPGSWSSWSVELMQDRWCWSDTWKEQIIWHESDLYAQPVKGVGLKGDCHSIGENWYFCDNQYVSCL